LNQELVQYIQGKLNKLMIDFNQGFIMSLSISEKQALKDQIDQIENKSEEQSNNV
jgi:hypothetical protein